MTDQNDMTDSALDRMLAQRISPSPISEDLSARLQAIPQSHKQRAPGGAAHRQSWSLKALWRLISPAAFIGQASAMMAALVIGVWMGIESSMITPPTPVEVDVAMWLSQGDMDLYGDQEEEL